MKGLRYLKGAAVAVASLGLLLPSADLMAAAPQKKVVKAPAKKMAPVVDVALSTGGTFTGQVVDAQGLGLAGATVSIRKGDREVARTTADKHGKFAVKNLRGGLYHVVAGQGEASYRLWAPNTAPPSARTKTLIVSGNSKIRGQWGGLDAVDYVALGLGTAGTVLGAIALEKANSQYYGSGD